MNNSKKRMGYRTMLEKIINTNINSMKREEKIIKFKEITGFNIDDFIELYLSNILKIESNINLNFLRILIKEVGIQKIIQVNNILEKSFNNLNKKNKETR